ncbi:MAG: arginine--tRNA ligase, partial [Candidatus Methanofastidiosa archaeon]|nr:arginine--tRNA ligase [Candidatus Methanofastidiosa archaeon]
MGIFKIKLIRYIEIATGLKNVDLEVQENQSFGDYSTSVSLKFNSHGSGFSQKFEGLNSRQVAEKLLEMLKASKDLSKICDKIEIAGPGFINFWLKKDVLVENLKQVIEDKNNYGKSLIYKGDTIEVEHTSPNPNKSMHLGHLRNNIVGMAISNLFEATGARVIRDCVDNNRGIAIAKLMWGYLKFARRDGEYKTDLKYWAEHQEEWQTPEDIHMRPDRFVDMLYVKGSADFESDESVEKTVRQMVVDWEAEEVNNRKLWEKVLSYSYAGQKLTLDRLKSRWDKVWHESDHYKKGKEFVESGLEKGIFKKTDDGAVVTDLSKYNLTDTIVIKKDGTALYITQDIALTNLKKNEYHADKMFWVIGPEQSLAMKQMFAVCDQLGIGNINEFTHIAYGYMSIKGQGKMSSRLGNVVYIDDLLDTAKDGVKEIMLKNNFDKDEIEKVSEMVGVGAVKYSILKVARLQDMSFDLKESISLEGNSGPYLQYTVARCNSVIAKASN